jgi:hypothetical protein
MDGPTTNTASSLPHLRYKPSLHPETEPLLAESALELSMSFPRIWRLKPAICVESIDLVSLDRIGGEYGYGGSRVFVAALIGRNTDGDSVVSVPLLVKVVEGNSHYADKLLAEKERYASIGNLLIHRYHAVPLKVYPTRKDSTSTRILWSEFLDENIVGGLPTRSPYELRYHLEKGAWKDAADCLSAAYKILQPAHDNNVCRHISFFSHYSQYLRLEKGWRRELASSLGHKRSIRVLGSIVRNPLGVFEIMEEYPTKCCGQAVLSAVHGDLHPRNIISGDIQRAALIDFGWAQGSFHTIIDFVLMELSVKFFYLPWFINRQELASTEKDLLDDLIPSRNARDEWLAGASTF